MCSQEMLSGTNEANQSWYLLVLRFWFILKSIIQVQSCQKSKAEVTDTDARFVFTPPAARKQSKRIVDVTTLLKYLYRLEITALKKNVFAHCKTLIGVLSCTHKSEYVWSHATSLHHVTLINQGNVFKLNYLSLYVCTVGLENHYIYEIIAC